MRAARTTILAAAFAAACTGREAPPAPAPPAVVPAPAVPAPVAATPAPPPPPAPPPAAALEPPPAAAYRALGPAGGLAAWGAGRKAVRVQALDGAGAPTAAAREVPLTSAHRLHAVYAVGDGFAVAAHDLCPDRKYFYKCLFVRGFTARGEPAGAELQVTTREWIREELTARADGVTALLTSHMYIPPAIAILSFGPDGALAVARRDLETGVEGEPVNAAGLEPTAAGFAILLRTETDEPARPIRMAVDRQGRTIEGPTRARP